VSQLSREVAVVGVGYSRLSRGDDPDPRRLTYDACREALDDAGVPATDVDGIYEYFHEPGEAPPSYWVQRQFGIPNLNAYLDFSNGPSGMGPPMVAAMAVASGVCEVALAYRTLPQRQGNNARVAQSLEAAGPAQFTDVYGHGAGILVNYALKKRRRIAELGASAEEYGLISINARRWAALNERALLRKPITMEDYLNSRVIVDPLLLFDCDYPINGSCALLITTGERARELVHEPVYFDSIAWGTGAGADFNFMDDYLFGGSFDCSKRLWDCSQFKPEDVDTLAIYDGFTHLPISWIEALGFCGVGEFGGWVKGGEMIGPGGGMPLNTSGGMLAEGRLQGIGLVAEAVVQLRGEAGERQVPDARLAVVAGGGSNDCGAYTLYSKK
jgi:acetyl-CoA acetyltransferase